MIDRSIGNDELSWRTLLLVKNVTDQLASFSCAWDCWLQAVPGRATVYLNVVDLRFRSLL